MFLDCKKIRCRYCHRPILMIKGNDGRTCAFDLKKVAFVPDIRGENKYILPDGLVVWGMKAKEEDPDRHIGYISHAATCPRAIAIRKKVQQE